MNSWQPRKFAHLSQLRQADDEEMNTTRFRLHLTHHQPHLVSKVQSTAEFLKSFQDVDGVIMMPLITEKI